jgi:plastocyanin
MRVRAARPTVALPVLAAFILAGCSLAESTEPPAPAATNDATIPGAQTTSPADPVSATRRVDPRQGGLEVGFGEYAITLEAEEIRPGPVTFVIRNGGALVHGFEIEAEDDDGDHSGSGNGELKLEGPEFGPNDVVRIDANLPPGVYEVECFIGEHDDMGMRATLVVTEDAPLRTDRPSAVPGDVRVADFAFSPVDTEVPAGTQVTWTNEDPTSHTITADDGGFDSGTLDPGGTFSFVFTRPGTYRYSCLIHPAMRGTVRVA